MAIDGSCDVVKAVPFTIVDSFGGRASSGSSGFTLGSCATSNFLVWGYCWSRRGYLRKVEGGEILSVRTQILMKAPKM